MTSALIGGCPQNGGRSHIFLRKGNACIMCGAMKHIPAPPSLGVKGRPRPGKPGPSPARWDTLVARDGPDCRYCGVPLVKPVRRAVDDPTPLAPRHLSATYLHPVLGTFDHVIPKAKKGSSRLENLVLSCDWCNGMKGDKDAEEFRQSTALAKRRRKVEALRAAADRGYRALG